MSQQPHSIEIYVNYGLIFTSMAVMAFALLKGIYCLIISLRVNWLISLRRLLKFGWTAYLGATFIAIADKCLAAGDTSPIWWFDDDALTFIVVGTIKLLLDRWLLKIIQRKWEFKPSKTAIKANAKLSEDIGQMRTNYTEMRTELGRMRIEFARMRTELIDMRSCLVGMGVGTRAHEMPPSNDGVQSKITDYYKPGTNPTADTAADTAAPPVKESHYALRSKSGSVPGK